MTIKDFRIYMRIGHRYVGYFMAGIMLVYALSGMLLVFRNTDFLKHEQQIHKTLAPNLNQEQLAKELRMRNVELKPQQGTLYSFKDGTYNTATGEVNYTVKKLPIVLEKMNNFHKSSSKSKLGGLNFLFGSTLLFFVVSSFFLFAPNSKMFKRGMAFVAVGAVLSVVLLMV